jgi:hypothetical protein
VCAIRPSNEYSDYWVVIGGRTDLRGFIGASSTARRCLSCVEVSDNEETEDYVTKTLHSPQTVFCFVGPSDIRLGHAESWEAVWLGSTYHERSRQWQSGDEVSRNIWSSLTRRMLVEADRCAECYNESIIRASLFRTGNISISKCVQMQSSTRVSLDIILHFVFIYRRCLGGTPRELNKRHTPSANP